MPFSPHFYNTHIPITSIIFFFFFNDTATTEIYTLSLHDALPICLHYNPTHTGILDSIESLFGKITGTSAQSRELTNRSEEHTSELQSQFHLVCRLLLEKKKKKNPKNYPVDTQHHRMPARDPELRL